MPPRITLEHMPGTRIQTVDDYFRLDDDGRTELLDGEFVVSPSPTWAHQRAVLCLAAILMREVESRRLGKVALGPIDVELSRTTVVHPDVLFVAAANLARIGRHLVGPPDLAVEFLSPSNPENDLDRKMKLYLRHGVPEYWIGNSESKTIRVLENLVTRWREVGTFKPGDRILSPRMPGVVVEVSEVFEA